DTRGPRAAVGFDHIAIERDRPFAQGLHVDHGPDAAADQALNLGGPAVDLTAPLARLPRRRASRQHVVLRRQPTLLLPLEPGRHRLFETRRAEDRRATGGNQDAAGSGPRVLPLDFQFAKLRWFTTVVTHYFVRGQ